jgi:hypothetical protein
MVNRERSGVAVGFISFAGIVLILAGVFHVIDGGSAGHRPGLLRDLGGGPAWPRRHGRVVPANVNLDIGPTNGGTPAHHQRADGRRGGLEEDAGGSSRGW